MITGSASKVKNSQWGCALFSLTFLGIGGVVVYFLFVQPLMGILRSRSWIQTPCVIRSSRVQEGRTSKGRRTYQLDLRYEYVHWGRSFTSARYSWVEPSSSGSGQVRDIVRRLPAGQETQCYVDPEHPEEAVLDREWHPALLFGLFPLILVAIGIIGLIGVLRSKSIDSRAGLRKSSASGLAAPEEPPGPKVLKPSESPASILIGLLLFGLFWNGIIYVVLWQNISQWRQGGHPWVISLFLLPFVAIGLGIFWGIFRQFLVLFNPRVNLTLGEGRVPLGGSVDLRWESTGNLGRIESYRIVLLGQEKGTYGSGKSRRTRSETFSEITIAEGPGGEDLRSGSAVLTVPAHLVPSFRSDHNEILWAIRVEGFMTFWPRMKNEFEIEVVPGGRP